MRQTTSSLIRIFLVCLLALPFSGICSSSSDSALCLRLSGRAILEKKLVKGKYTVELIRNGTVIDSLKVKDNSTFTFFLNKNSSYLIRISKKGHMTRLVSVRTNMNDSEKQTEIHNLYFQTDLMPLKEALSLYHEALELPIAIISFNKNTKKFDHNKGYTAFVKRRIYTGS